MRPYTNKVNKVSKAPEHEPSRRYSGDVLVIEPHKGWLSIDFSELWLYRELLFFLVWRDIKVRYKQTVLGASWAIIRPVISMIVFSAIFSRLLGVKPPADATGRIIAYPIYLYAALLPWTLFQTSVSMSGISLVGQAHLLTKIYMPRLFIPASNIGTCLIDFALSFGVYMVLMISYRQLPGMMVLLLPVLLLLTVMTALGVGFLLSSLTVTYRDFRHVLPFMLQTWMFLTPVVYPVDKIPERFRFIMAFNPMYGIVEGFRSALLNRPMDWRALGIAAAAAALLFVFGMLVFRRMERRFADIA